jgi:hypothetical protein
MKLSLLKKYIKLQAQDESLWYVATYAPESMLQAALREVSRLIETESLEKIREKIESYKLKLKDD